jgi:hypothetical protein
VGNSHPKAGILSGALLSIKACNSISLSSDVARSSPDRRRIVAGASPASHAAKTRWIMDRRKIRSSLSPASLKWQATYVGHKSILIIKAYTTLLS